MRRFIPLVLLLSLLFTLAVVPVQIQAQDLLGMPNTLTSRDGRLSLVLPDTWDGDARSVPVTGGQSAILAFAVSQPSAASKINMPEGTVLLPGEAVLGVTAGPLGAMFNASPDAGAVGMLRAALGASLDQYGPIQELTIQNHPAARAERNRNGSHEVDFMLDMGEGNYVLVIGFTPSDEFAIWEPALQRLVESVKYDPYGLTQTYTVSNDIASFRYPQGWQATAAVMPGRSDTIIIGGLVSSPAVAQQLQQGANATLNQGEVAIQLMVGNLTSLYGVEPGADSRALASAYVQQNGFPEVRGSETTIGAWPATLLSRSAPGHDALDFVVAYRDNAYAIFTLYTARGELPEYGPLAGAVAETLTYGTLTVAPRATETPGEASSLAAGLGQPDTPNLPALDLSGLPEVTQATNVPLSVRYPSGWAARSASGNGVVVANSDAALDLSFGDLVAPGSIQILVAATTRQALLNSLGLGADADLLAIGEAMTRTTPADAGAVYDPPESIQVNLLFEAARIPFRAMSFEGAAYLVEYSDERFVIVQVLAAPGELGNWQSTIDSISAAIQYGN